MCEFDSKENTRVLIFYFKRENINLKWDKIDVKYIKVFVLKFNCNKRRILKGFWRSANSPTLLFNVEGYVENVTENLVYFLNIWFLS